jgi:HSP20 family protein
MANIAVRNEKQIAPVLDIPEPVQMLRDLLRWNPFREIAPHLMEGSNFVPAFEVRESKDRFVFMADLPGVKEADLEINLAGARLFIAGSRKPEVVVEEHETYFTSERAYGPFQRSFTLPEGIDPEHIVAELKEGVLTLVVPKTAEMKSRKILLKTGPKS